VIGEHYKLEGKAHPTVRAPFRFGFLVAGGDMFKSRLATSSNGISFCALASTDFDFTQSNP
jgi:hypothetical protein